MANKIGTCRACNNEIYYGERSQRILGHKDGCKNFGTKKLKK